MKSFCKIVSLLCFIPFCNIEAQNSNPNIDMFYKLVIGPSAKYQYVEPDSLKSIKELSDYATNLWAFNLYLYDNYSIEATKTDLLDSLLCDILELKIEHKKILNNDIQFQKLFFNAFNKKSIPSISIDSIQSIMAHFFYLHRRQNGNIVMHFCTTINEVLKLEQNDNTPFYNAFCYMVLKNQHPFDTLKTKITHYMSNEVDERILEEAKNKNYSILSKDPSLRQMIINEYELKKDYLNFKVIY